MRRRIASAVAGLVALALVPASPALAQEWPTRPVLVIHPFRPGGGGEQMVRLLLDRLSRDMGQQFVIENRAGAGGAIGAGVVTRARPDGYTLLVSGIATNVVVPVMLSVPFDSMKDFSHIALLGGPPQVLTVHPAFEAKTLRQYVELSRARPEAIAYGSPGTGTHGHLIGELFESLTGARMLHVPYSGGGPAAADLVAGHIPSAFLSLGAVSQYLRVGKLLALAVTAAKRVPDFPDMPTFAELGYEELNAITWFGLSGPAGLPRAIVVKLNAEVRAVLAQPDVRGKLLAEGIEPGDLDADGFTEFVRAEIARWSPLARTAKERSAAAGKSPAR